VRSANSVQYDVSKEVIGIEVMGIREIQMVGVIYIELCAAVAYARSHTGASAAVPKYLTLVCIKSLVKKTSAAGNHRASL